MDQNQTVDNDLQKAIDDITNTTNIDPVFSDPIPAPSTIPEDDSGKVGDPIGPFPNANLETFTPAPDPMAPLSPNATPELAPAPAAPTPELTPTDFSAPEFAMPTEQPLPTASPIPEHQSLETPAQEPAPVTLPASEPISSEIATAEVSMPVQSSEPITPESPIVEPTPEADVDTDATEIKAAALHDLAPLINKLPLDGTKKFDLCCKIGLDDKTVLNSAYQATHDIPDETERAEALLQIVESIDKM